MDQPMAVQVDLWRQRINAGEKVSMEEMKAAVALLRGSRVGVGAGVRKAKEPPKTEAEMMDELDNL